VIEEKKKRIKRDNKGKKKEVENRNVKLLHHKCMYANINAN